MFSLKKTLKSFRHRPKDAPAKTPEDQDRSGLRAQRSKLTPASSISEDIGLFSSILSTIPPEIRQQIWAIVLGDHLIHLEVQDESSLAGNFCASSSPQTCTRFFGGCGMLTAPENSRIKQHSLLPLLITCKQIYSEAIDLLYSSNQFVTDNEKLMERLPKFLLPQRIAAIRSLRFHWTLPFSPGRLMRNDHDKLPWERIWSQISMMRGLQTLHVVLNVAPLFWSSLNRESTETLLPWIEKVTAPKTFILTLPFPVMVGKAPKSLFPWAVDEGWEGVDPWEKLPCTTERLQK